MVRYYAPHTLPFLLMAASIYLGPITGLPKTILYPVQTTLTATALLFCWKDYRDEIRFTLDLSAIAGGIGVFLVWILLEGFYPLMGSPTFKAPESSNQAFKAFFLIFRITGAAIVIPLAEELFWRSFAMRFLENKAFKSIPLGQFSWFSFIAISLAFGFEHHRWLPGIIAGMAYAVLLYRTKNLFSPILSHAVTNLLLGVYVLSTGRREFW